MNIKRPEAKHCCKVKRTAEFYIKKSKLRERLAEELQACAAKYKATFRRVEQICDADITIPGAIAQVQSAFQTIKNKHSETETETEIGTHSQTDTEIRTEFIDAALDLINMHQAMDALEADGVPTLVSLELARRILDSDFEGSCEMMVADDQQDDYDI
jgi:hypothetical protein